MENFDLSFGYTVNTDLGKQIQDSLEIKNPLKRRKLNQDDPEHSLTKQEVPKTRLRSQYYNNSIEPTSEIILMSNLSSDSKELLSKYVNVKLNHSFTNSFQKSQKTNSQLNENIINSSNRSILKREYSDVPMRNILFFGTSNIKIQSPKQKENETGFRAIEPVESLINTDSKKPKAMLLHDAETIKRKVSTKSKMMKRTDKKFSEELEDDQAMSLFQGLMTQSKSTREKNESDILYKKSIFTKQENLSTQSKPITQDYKEDPYSLVKLDQPLVNNQTKKEKSKDKLINVKDFNLEELFPFESFNAFQSNCFDLIWNSNKNLIVSAPTGSGKTVLFELAIARDIYKPESKETNLFKAIYIAPIKALCQQKFMEWSAKFKKLNLNLLELTGDTEMSDFLIYDKANIIVTTPEKWDSITRKWKDNTRLVTNISLLLIDEVHLLNTEGRGATLEAIVSRMKIISKFEGTRRPPISNLRIIAISATIPNINDLGEWLEVSPDCIKNFGDEYRSTPIEKHVFGYNMPRNEFQFEKSLNYRLVEIIRKFSSGKPTLIFCQTQKGTVNACEQIIQDMQAHELVKGDTQLRRLLEAGRCLIDKNLQKFLPHGVAFHNAGMPYEDRRIIEDLFIKGFIQIICTTTTLAMGVNLPARLVIIKSTLCYRGSGIGYTEYSPLEIDQMVGRAGRPQFDTHGIVVIMTEKHNIEKYRKQTIDKEDLESHFSEQLAEHINAEIALGSIKSLMTVVEYLKGTFFYVRIKKKPKKYGIIGGSLHDPETKLADKYLMTTSQNIIQELYQYEMIQYDFKNGTVKPLELGIDMSKNYVSFATMKKFSENHMSQDLKGLLTVLSEAQEFEKIRSKLDERKTLLNLNSSIKFSLSGAISTASKKAYVLIQSGIGNLNLEDWELRKQQNEIMNASWRIMHCFKIFYLIKNLGQGLCNSLKLIKFISVRTWEEDSTTVLKQLPGIGHKLAATLCEAKIDSFDKIIETSSYIIERVCSKNPPFGAQLQRKAKIIPKIEAEISDIHNNGMKLKVAIKLQIPPSQLDKKEMKCGYQLIVEDKANRIQFLRYLALNQEILDGIAFEVHNLKKEMYPVMVSFINEKYVGNDVRYLIHANGVFAKFNGEFKAIQDKPNEVERSTGSKNNLSEDEKLNVHNQATRCSHSISFL